MHHALMKLPYALSALEPHISKETIEYHYGKHHAGYVKMLLALIENSKYEQMTLEEIIKSSEGPIFNNAAQVYNHNAYWHGLTDEQSNLSTELLENIERTFHTMDAFKKIFLDKAAKLFGSGWVWLSVDNENRLVIEQYSNADNPLRHHLVPLLACDLWEHAYYIDYRNERTRYLEHWWSLINWNFVSDNYAKYRIDTIEGYSQPCNDQSVVCDYVDRMQENEHVPT